MCLSLIYIKRRPRDAWLCPPRPRIYVPPRPEFRFGSRVDGALGKNFLTFCSIGRVRSRVRPLVRRVWPLALMLCAERVPIESPHLEVR
jgi:hypothetical protein